MANLAPYISSIRFIVVIFPFFALLLLLPFLIRQYHRYGAISGWMVSLNYAFVFYMLCIYALTILPLPTMAQVKAMTGPVENFRLFDFVKDFIDYSGFVVTQPATWLRAMKSPQFIQPFFNFLLTLPFGFFLHYHYKKRLVTSLILSFCLSLSFELIQRSALFGIYPRPYRLFDVDDLLLNTCGSMFGWWISGSIGKILPKKETIVQALEEKSDKVSVLRKSVAIFLDSSAIFILNAIYNIFIGKASFWVLLLIYLVWVVLPECLGRSTLGQKVVHLKLAQKSGEKAGFGKILLRNLFGYGFIAFLSAAELYVLGQTGTIAESELGIYYFLSLFGIFLFFCLGVSVIVSFFTKQFYYEILSGTRLISTYKKDDKA